MSVKVMNLVFQAGPPDMAERFVMLAIADNADDTGFAFPGVDTIALKSCQSERNTLRVLKQLERSGWLIIKRRCQGPKKQGNGYQLNLAMMVHRGDTVSSRTPHDTTSPRPKERSAKKDTCESPSDTVSPVVESEKRSDKSTTSEVTNTTKRSDKSCFPILINHQEPSGTKYSPLPPSRGVDKTPNEGISKAPTEGPTYAPLTGRRTAQEILDHYGAKRDLPRKSESSFEDIASIAKASVGGGTLRNYQLAFEGVMKSLRDNLMQTSISLGNNRPSHLTDGAEEWEKCFESVMVADYDSDETSGVPHLIVTSDNPRATEAAMQKYKLRIQQAMQKFFGQIVQISVRSEAA